MSFRGRLRLFFALIVIVPMVALGIVLFTLTERTETGKADAGIATATRAAVGVYREDVVRAPARYSGEEMAVVLPQTDAAGAAQLAERMREGVEALQVPR